MTTFNTGDRVQYEGIEYVFIQYIHALANYSAGRCVVGRNGNYVIARVSDLTLVPAVFEVGETYTYSNGAKHDYYRVLAKSRGHVIGWQISMNSGEINRGWTTNDLYRNQYALKDAS